jgi:hypothetical protein
LYGDYSAGKSKQPDRELFAKLMVPKLNHSSAQTKTRALREKAEQTTNDATAHSQNQTLAKGVVEKYEIHLI